MAKAVRQTAEQFRVLPTEVPIGVHPRPERAMLIQADTAGRLLADAFAKGAFSCSDILPEMLAVAADGPDRYAACWFLARQKWLGERKPEPMSLCPRLPEGDDISGFIR